jgi:predicted RNA-binding Zn-ribbon protein involved in translation (DUF1610 family)
MTTVLDAERAAIYVKAHGLCPMCDQDAWVGGDQIVRLSGEPALEGVPFVCTNCGFVRLHSLQPLETQDD